MPSCDSCGAWVTTNYHRVFSDNDGVLHGCQDCGTNSQEHNPNAKRRTSTWSV